MTMQDREKDFEARFAHDEALRFRVEARRNKLLGLWAAGELGKSGEDAITYSQEVVKADFAKPGDDHVFAKLREDFDSAGVEKFDHQIRRTMAEFMIEAEKQVLAD